MTATFTTSAAILKSLYPKGQPTLAIWKEFPLLAMLPKSTDFKGDGEYVALQNEDPQGVGITIADAQTAIQPGTYNRFLITGMEHFGVIRVKGRLLRAADGNEGSLVDIWKSESAGIARTLMKTLTAYAYGTGTGTLGSIATSSLAATSLTLNTVTDIINFAVGMRVQAVSDNTTSPTLRSGSAVITAIDRSAGTLTTGTNWGTQITSIAQNDYLIRYGTAATSGTVNVMQGIRGWIPGGSSPGTLFGLSRNTDPVRLAGQTYNATGVPIVEAIIEGISKVTSQGDAPPTHLFINNREAAALKKSEMARVVTIDSKVPGLSFSGFEFQGDYGPIKIVPDPFCPRYAGMLLNMNAWNLRGTGPVPHLQNYDSLDFMRVSNDDSLEARWAAYCQLRCNYPSSNLTFTNLGN